MEKTREITDKDIQTIKQYNLMADNKKHKILTIFTVGTMVSAFILLIVVLTWLLWPYKVIEYSPPTEYNIIYGLNKDNEVKQGGVIAYEFDYIKYSDVNPEVSRRFVDGIVFNAAEGSVDLEEGSGHAIIESDIPETLPPGKYYLEIIRKFKVNPIRTITITSRTEEFTVIEAHESE